MDKKTFPEKRNPGSLDFIEISLNENSRDLKKLFGEIQNLSEKIDDHREPTNTVEIQNRINTLQLEIEKLNKVILEIENLKKGISTQTQQPPIEIKETKKVTPTFQVMEVNRAPIIVKCNLWEDFQTFASGAEKISVTFRESEKLFEADALKGNQIIVFIGNPPEQRQLLKAWLTCNLSSPGQIIFEGTLTGA